MLPAARPGGGAGSAPRTSGASLAGVSGRSMSSTPSASATALAMQTGVVMQLPSPTPFAPSGVNGEGVSHVQDERIRHLDRGRQQIVGEGAGQEAAVGGVGVFLVERGAERLGEAAADLPVDHGRDAGCGRSRAS